MQPIHTERVWVMGRERERETEVDHAMPLANREERSGEEATGVDPQWRGQRSSLEHIKFCTHHYILTLQSNAISIASVLALDSDTGLPTLASGLKRPTSQGEMPCILWDERDDRYIAATRQFAPGRVKRRGSCCDFCQAWLSVISPQWQQRTQLCWAGTCEKAWWIRRIMQRTYGFQNLTSGTSRFHQHCISQDICYAWHVDTHKNITWTPNFIFIITMKTDYHEQKINNKKIIQYDTAPDNKQTDLHVTT